MTRGRFILWVLIVLAVWQGWQHWRLRAVRQPDGVLARDPPEQTAPAHPEPFTVHGARVTPRADYRLRARLLARKRYHFDRVADYATLDFGVGWGGMSDNRVLSVLELSQSNRFFWLHWPDQPPLPESELFSSLSNNHLIPANDAVAAALDKMRIGQVIELSGQLVDIDAPDGWFMRTSLTRTDNGGGACEVFYVQRADVFLRGQ